MDDHFDIGRVFEIGKFDITRLTCISNTLNVKPLVFSKEKYSFLLFLLYLQIKGNQ